MKMRAVPDGFDNVQALHSPYGSYPGGALHVVGPPIHSPMEYPQSHGDYGLGLRPLMVDPTRGSEHDDHFASGSLPSSYGQAGYTHQTPVGTTDMLSSLSNQSGRYFSNYPSQIPLAQHRDTSLYTRHNSMDSYGMQATREEARPIHTLQPPGRSRSDSLQSPLRTSMSWKGDTLDYGNYQQPQTLSPSNPLRQAPLYQGDLSTSVNSQQPQYSSDTYACKPSLSSVFDTSPIAVLTWQQQQISTPHLKIPTPSVKRRSPRTHPYHAFAPPPPSSHPVSISDSNTGHSSHTANLSLNRPSPNQA